MRFIEYMDVGATNGWRMDDVVPAREIVRDASAREMPLVAADPNYRGEVAERWAYADGSGEIGVIASVTQAFCRDCTRARLSTEGKLYTCLFASEGFDLRELLRERRRRRGARAARSRRSGGSAATAIRRFARPNTAARAPKVEMSYIGGERHERVRRT